MRKFKFYAALIAGIFMLSATAVSATVTRTGGMGLDNHAWAIDGLQPYVYENPAVIGKFKDTAFFEAGATEFGGIFLNPTGNITVALFSGLPADLDGRFGTLGPTTHSLYDLAASAGYAGIANISTPIHGIGLWSGKHIGFLAGMNMGKMDVGFGIAYTSAGEYDKLQDTATLQDTELDKTERETQILGGLEMEMGGMLKSIGVGLDITMYGLSNTYTDNTTPTISAEINSSGAMDLNVHARADLAVSQKNILHVLLGYESKSQGVEITQDVGLGGDGTASYSQSVIKLGLSDEIKVGANAIVFVGLELQYSSGDSEVTAGGLTVTSEDPSDLTIPFFLGTEGKISENWEGRFGLTHNLRESTTTPYQGATQTGEQVDINAAAATTTLNTGLSYAFGNFKFDWWTNVAIFRNGPNFISGGVTPFATGLAATFNFGDTAKSPAAN